jgi:DNA repair protein RadA/Sms
LDKIQPLSPRALIIDSIQTVYVRSFAGSAGNLSQVLLLVHLIFF